MSKAQENMPEDATDAALLLRVQAADQQAFAVLVNRHALRFRSIAQRVLSDTAQAEEVVQEAFVTLWTKPDAFDPLRAKFTTWFHRVVVNRALDHKRRKQAMQWPEGYDVTDERPRADNMVEQKNQMAALQAALATLPERQKTALILSYLDGYSNNQAADIMALNVKAFESLLLRARAKMRDMLAAEKENLLSVFG